MGTHQQRRLDDLAEELTRRLGIPFVAAGNGTIAFRDRMRITDWAVPLMFDGHVARDQDAIIPLDFVGHLLWPTLQVSRANRRERPWWYCKMNLRTAEAMVEALREDDEHPLDEGRTWVIGRDVLLDELVAAEPAPRKRRRVA
jgi:hypothetical protein